LIQGTKMNGSARMVVEAINGMQLGPNGKKAGERKWSRWRQNEENKAIQDLTNASFVDADLSHCNFSGLDFTGASFLNCDLASANFNGAIIKGIRVECDQESPANLNTVNFSSTNAEGAIFENCDLGNADLRSSSLVSAKFQNCNLSSAKFSNKSLAGVVFGNVSFNSTTEFRNVNDVQGMRVDRYALACLGSDVGGFTLGQQMGMVIIDDAANLRQEFGGVWGLLHLLALVAFAAPYAWFLTYNWSLAQFSDDESGVTLLRAFCRFIATGGNAWKQTLTFASINWISLTSFLTYATYNVARGFLLWKTKRLETEEQVKGLPVKFSLKRERRWELCYRFCRAMFWVAVAAVIINTFNFLQVKLPAF